MYTEKTKIFRNKRIALLPGTMLTDEICIVSLLSDAGGSSLVYKATRNGNNTIIKEYYPYESQIKIIRDLNGYKLLSRSEECNTKEEKLKHVAEEENFRAQLHLSFENEIHNSKLANRINGNNSIHSFNCNDINDQVQANPLFKGSLALYMEIETKSGRTLLEEMDFLRSTNESHDINLDQAIELTIHMLNCLSSKHKKQKLLHLDLKPDNIYFPDELDLKKTYCVFLDCGNYQPINNVSSHFGFSASRGYAAYEINQVIDNLRLADASPTSSEFDVLIEKFTKYIGTHTDLYSIGMMFFQLVMGNDFDKHTAYEMNTTSSQKTLKRLLESSIKGRMEDKISYAIDIIVNILSQALYVPRNYNDLIENRYTSCDDFIADLNKLLEIIEMRGIHPEIIDVNSHKEFINVIRLAGIPVASVRTNEDLIEDETLFDSRLFPEVIITNENQQS